MCTYCNLTVIIQAPLLVFIFISALFKISETVGLKIDLQSNCILALHCNRLTLSHLSLYCDIAKLFVGSENLLTT